MNATDIRDTVTIEYIDYKNQYDDMLNDCHNDYYIGDLCFTASQVLESCDEIAYCCGFIDWLNSLPDPWECGKCDSRYETEEEAEECCQE